jgi:hypothetical protein
MFSGRKVNGQEEEADGLTSFLFFSFLGLFATVLVSPEGVGDAAFRWALLPRTSL